MENTKFNCTKCGACCRNIPLNEIVNGVCLAYDHETKLCTIYEERPLVCRVEEGYDTFFHNLMTRDEFYRLNEEACKKLQSK